MSRIDPLHPLQSGILECLARRPGLTMEELHLRLNDDSVAVSLPNLYRAVSQMIDVQMLVKNKGRVSLHTMWLESVQAFLERVSGIYAADIDAPDFVLQEGDRREYMAESLTSLGPIWSYVLEQCAEIEKNKEWLSYASHPWHVIGMNDTEMSTYRSLAAKGVACRIIYGNDGFLDRYAIKLLKVPRFRAGVSAEVSLPREGYAVWICGDYLIESTLPEAIAKRFGQFFQETENMEDFDPELFEDVFRMKARCKLVLRRNKNDAGSLRMILKKA